MVLEVLAEMRKCGTSVFAYDYDTVHQLFRGLGDDGIWAKKLRGYGELVEDTEPEAYIERIRAGELKIIKMAICQPEETIQRVYPTLSRYSRRRADTSIQAQRRSC